MFRVWEFGSVDIGQLVSFIPSAFFLVAFAAAAAVSAVLIGVSASPLVVLL